MMYIVLIIGSVLGAGFIWSALKEVEDRKNKRQ